MIGKSLRERYALGPLPVERAVAVLKEVLPVQAPHLVEVRARGPQMIACLVVRADKPTVRLCRTLGVAVKAGGTGVFGLEGGDAARLFGELSLAQRAWLEAPCGQRETKVLLVASGTALLSLETSDGKVVITRGP